MNLVNDVDAVAPIRRRVLHLLPDIADIFHAIVGCRIDLHHIEGSSFRNLAAHTALAAGAAVHRMFTVDCPCKDLGNTRLTGSARPAEEVRVPDPPGVDLIFQGLYDMVLTPDLFKGRRTPFSVQCCI